MILENDLNCKYKFSEEKDMNISVKCSAFEETGKPCPACGSTETQNRGPYWYCTRCDYEW